VALKVIQGARVLPEQQPQQPQQGFLSSLGSALSTGALGAAKGVSGLVGGIEGGLGMLISSPVLLADYLSGGKLHTKELLKMGLPETVKGPLGQIPQQLEKKFPTALQHEPQNPLEYLLQRGTEQSPFIAMGGVNPQTLGRTGLGLLGATGARSAGFGPMGQNIAQMITEGGYGAATRSGLGKKASIAYESAGEGGPGAVASQVSSEPLKPIFTEIERKYNAAIKPAQRTVLENLNKSLENAQSGIGKVSLGKLFDTRTALSEAYSDLKNAGFSALATKTRKAINATILGEEAKIINPKYWNAVSSGDKLKIAEHLRQPVADWAERLVDKFPKLPGNAQNFAKIAVPVIRAPEAFVGYMLNPTFRKHAFDLMFAVEEGGQKDMYKYLGQLASVIGKENKTKEYSPQKDISNKLGKLRVIPGARVIVK